MTDDTAGSVPQKHSRRRTLLIALLLLLLLVAGLLVWVLLPGDGSDDSDSPLREDLNRSAELLRGAPALHYTGTIKVKGQEDARVDLIVDNPGDGLGTLAKPDGPAVDYVGVDGKSYLRGDTEAWQGLGMASASKVLAKDPRRVAPGVFFRKDLAGVLAPPALAKTLLFEDVPDKKITAGDPVEAGDHTCTPVHADGMTVCLGEKVKGDARFVDRVTFPGKSLVLDIEPMSRKAVREFSRDFRSTLPLTYEAVDDQIDVTNQILRDYKGKCAPTACTFRSRTTVTYLGSAAAPEAAKDVRVRYAWVMKRDGRTVKVGPGCSGTLLIKPGRSKDLACTATGSSVPAGQTSGQYSGAIHTSDFALTKAEYEDVLRLAADNAEKVEDLHDLPAVD
ncbi:hypothetical protein [Streptomyces sp. NPDC051684]|uniref:hypothetical protein n=1 Tax=Streptomyces sp. NPDC051684 TaxID=3365670 RepID=UPI00378DF047